MKQTVQFKYEDVSYFKKNSQGQLRCLPRDAPDELIATADGLTLSLTTKRMGERVPAYTMKPMATNGCARYVHWHFATSIYAPRTWI